MAAPPFDQYPPGPPSAGAGARTSTGPDRRHTVAQMRRRRERQEDDLALLVGIAIWLIIVGTSVWRLALQPWLLERGWI